LLGYQLNAGRLRGAKPSAIVLHPGPMNRGIEITPEVATARSRASSNKSPNGIAVRNGASFPASSPARPRMARIPWREALPAKNRRSTDQKDPSHALVKNGRVLVPHSKTDAALDVLLDGEKIKEVAAAGKITALQNTEVFDAAGWIVAPGFIDLHAQSSRTWPGVFRND